ncbi:MAG TPA: sugar phosphate isomerase/epimerase family protein [Verrucomicrobiae bacterium]|nr:sugar phosphate isomerase/epimerase family protein [Verrucomicrobiae bacterium]
MQTRREFLTTTAAASALALSGQSFAAESAKKRAIKKGIMYSTIGVGKTVMEKFQAAKEAGFEGVEAMSHYDQEDVLKARDQTGLKIPSVCGAHHWAKPLSDPNPGVREQAVEALKQTLRDAKRYGATSVLLVPAVVNKNTSYQDAYTRSQAEIKKAIPLAEELQVKIAIENVWNGFLLSPLEAARYVDEFNSPWVGWHFDIGNVINFGWPEQWVRVLGKRIQKLHIKEYSRKKRDKEGPGAGFGVPFLEGDNDWPSIMKALDEIGYDGWGIAEQGGGGTPEGLRDLAERMDKIFAA